MRELYGLEFCLLGTHLPFSFLFLISHCVQAAHLSLLWMLLNDPGAQASPEATHLWCGIKVSRHWPKELKILFLHLQEGTARCYMPITIFVYLLSWEIRYVLWHLFNITFLNGKKCIFGYPWSSKMLNCQLCGAVLPWSKLMVLHSYDPTLHSLRISLTLLWRKSVLGIATEFRSKYLLLGFFCISGVSSNCIVRHFWYLHSLCILL